MKAQTCVDCEKPKPIKEFSQYKYTNKAKTKTYNYTRKYCKSCGTLRIEKLRKTRQQQNLCPRCGIEVQGKTIECDECLERRRTAWKARKVEVFSHYGGSSCSCCGENNIEFLSIDHINGDGRKHRKELGSSGTAIYSWLKTQKYPIGYRVLCMNCNCAMGWYGKCPHKNS
jgi:hypothetical protein